MTGFVELQPTGKSAGTCVRLGLTERGGLIVSLWGEAIEMLGGGEPGPCKAFLDMDPALPRLRVERHPEGRFEITMAPRGADVRLIRLGHHKPLMGKLAKRLDCSWESVDGKTAIDIDLPREWTAAPVRREAPVQAPGTSTSNPRRISVSLPRVGDVESGWGSAKS